MSKEARSSSAGGTSEVDQAHQVLDEIGSGNIAEELHGVQEQEQEAQQPNITPKLPILHRVADLSGPPPKAQAKAASHVPWPPLEEVEGAQRLGQDPPQAQSRTSQAGDLDRT